MTKLSTLYFLSGRIFSIDINRKENGLAEEVLYIYCQNEFNPFLTDFLSLHYSDISMAYGS